MVSLLAIWLPERTFHLVADSTYIGAKLLRDLPANVQAVGPIHPKANLTFLASTAGKPRTPSGCPPRPK